MRNTEYDNEFRLEAVELALDIGQTAAARKLDIPHRTLVRWMQRYHNNQPVYNNGRRHMESFMLSDNRPTPKQALITLLETLIEDIKNGH